MKIIADLHIHSSYSRACILLVILLLGINPALAEEQIGAGSSPPLPYPILLRVYYNNEPLNSTLTSVTNLDTRETQFQYTDENGAVLYELANFKIRYQKGDRIHINVCLNDSRCNKAEKDYIAENGPINSEFRLITEKLNETSKEAENKNVYVEPIEEAKLAQESLVNSTIFYIDNSSQYIIKNINNTTYENTNINNSSYNDYSKNISLGGVTLFELSVGGFTLLGIWFLIYQKFKKKSKNKNPG